MRIVFDFNSVLTNRYSGFFTYGAGLLSGFATLPNPPQLSLFLGRKVISNVSWLGNLTDPAYINLMACPIKMRHLGAWWRKFPFPTLQRFTGPLDLYHCNHHLMPPTKNRPRLLTVHDLRRYRFPQYYPHSKLAPFEHALRTADRLIAISKATKTDLCELFNINPDKIDVVYHGGPVTIQPQPSQMSSTPPSQQPQSLLAKFKLQPHRFFTVFSSYDRRKNLDNIIKAFSLALPQLPKDIRLVIIGQLPDKKLFPPDLPENFTNRVICTGPLNDFSELLGQSCALVYASLYEGFGLPILEAMNAGAAVLTSNCSSMPEVAGNAALLVDPLKIDQITDAVLDLARDDSLRKKLVAAGHERAKLFSWQRAAQDTLNVYQKLIG